MVRLATRLACMIDASGRTPAVGAPTIRHDVTTHSDNSGRTRAGGRREAVVAGTQQPRAVRDLYRVEPLSPHADRAVPLPRPGRARCSWPDERVRHIRRRHRRSRGALHPRVARGPRARQVETAGQPISACRPGGGDGRDGRARMARLRLVRQGRPRRQDVGVADSRRARAGRGVSAARPSEALVFRARRTGSPRCRDRPQ